ncbi:MAG: hypothetical protein ACYTG1_07875 [Planctomycetota bacterium]
MVRLLLLVAPVAALLALVACDGGPAAETAAPEAAAPETAPPGPPPSVVVSGPAVPDDPPVVPASVGRRVESNAGTYRVTWSVRGGGPVPLNEPFAIVTRVLDAEGRPATGVSLEVDASMPEHRHGLNRRPDVQALGQGSFEVDGVLLHMPGRWELYFDVVRDGAVERAQEEIVLE